MYIVSTLLLLLLLHNNSTIPKIRQSAKQCARGTNWWNDYVKQWESDLSVRKEQDNPSTHLKLHDVHTHTTLHPCTHLTKCLNCCQSASCHAETCPKYLMTSQNCVWSICLETFTKHSKNYKCLKRHFFLSIC